MFKKEELIRQIREMGILPTDTVLIHTSMRAVGAVENGADGVIDAFRDFLCDGLFIVPTHTWANVNRTQPVYDVRSTVPCIGALPCAAAFRPDGVRSLHPTHSVWATGRNAAAFVHGEENAQTPCPPGFAWARLAQAGAKILLIGVGHERNTFIHAIDELADVPDRLHTEPFNVTIIDHAGNAQTHPFTPHFCSRFVGISAKFGRFEKPLILHGAQREGRLGNAQVKVVDAARCCEIIRKIYAAADRDVCLDYEELPESLYL